MTVIMNTRTLWRRVPANSIDRAFYGRIIKAYAHPCGALLLHHRPVSRNCKSYDLVGAWLVVLNDVLVRRRSYLGRRQWGVPLRWANKALREYRAGIGQSCDLIDGRRPTVAESVGNKSVEVDELPPYLCRSIWWNHDKKVQPRKSL
jgi:hypothetical protein